MKPEPNPGVLCYADGTPVEPGDKVTIRHAKCTVLRVVPDSTGKPWVVACLIEGMGEREMGVFADTFQTALPQKQPRDTVRATT